MSDKLIQVTAQNIVADTPAYSTKLADAPILNVQGNAPSSSIVANVNPPTPASANLIVQNAVATSFNISDITTNVEKTKLVVTVTNMGEESIPSGGLFRRATDYYTAVDSISLSYRPAKTSQASTQDTFSRFVNYRRVLQEPQVTNDSYKVFVVGKGIAETFAVSEALSLNFAKSLATAFVQSDTVSLNSTKVVADLLGLADVASLQAGKSLQDLGTVADTLISTVSFNRDFNDFVDITDDFLGEANLDDDQTAFVGKTLVNWISGSDTAVVLLQSQQQDQVFSVDQPSFEVDSIALDSTSSTDTVSLGPVKSAFDSSLVTETAIFSANKTLLDTGSSIDLAYVDLYTQLAVTANAQETLLAQVSKPLQEQFELTDIAQIVWQAYNNSTSTLVATDSLTTSIVAVKQDQASSTDQFSYTASKTASSSFTSTDTVSTLVNFNRDFNDQIFVTDDFLGSANLDDDQTAFVNKVLINISSTVDLATNAVTKLLDSAANAGDSLTNTTGKNLANSVGLSDTAQFFLFTNRFFNETAATNDSGFINNQNYFAESYVEPGYAGTNTNFS